MEKRFAVLILLAILSSSFALAVCEDVDGDLYVIDPAQCTDELGLDCNDNNPNINHGTQEDCNDGIDNDCNGYIDGTDPNCGCEDTDFDNYLVNVTEDVANCGSLDCDDTNA